MHQKNIIRVIGAREHNLKNITVAIPKNTLTVITGPSGSGKSSLAFDILFTEGKRRYMESLSSYARQFLGIAKKPDVERIDGLCPAIAIDQKTVGANPRSTVGTITEIADYLRVLFARIGLPHCPGCQRVIQQESPETIAAMLMAQFNGQTVTIAAPMVVAKKGEFVADLRSYFASGYYRMIIDGVAYKFRSAEELAALQLKKTVAHTIYLLLDAVTVSPADITRLDQSVEKAFALTGGSCVVIDGSGQEHNYSMHRLCVHCHESFPELEPRLFSFNSPIGACAHCHGLGMIASWETYETLRESGHHVVTRPCSLCDGKRLNKYALHVVINDRSIYDVGLLSIKQLMHFLTSLSLTAVQREIAQGLLREIVNRLTFLHNVGLGYLSLNRQANTLSGGEGQRIRLATQIGSALSGVLYILDEPSIGLHQRDNDRLIATLQSLRDQDNTVVVVEHDMDTIEHADHLIDMGPGAGIHGGTVTAQGTPAQVAQQQDSLTGRYLAGTERIAVPAAYRTANGTMVLHAITKNNLKPATVKFPLGILCGVSGVSGSGKSTLVMQELVPAVRKELERSTQYAGHDAYVTGANTIRELVVIDQAPIGRTPRSNPATYLGIFDDIRALFAQLPESNARGYSVGRFSFNVAEGRCFECKGEGVIQVSMHFLPDVTMTCKTCKGKRYNAQTLQIEYKERNIYQILCMTAAEARDFFAHHATIAKRLQLLCDVGLDYLTLGQPATTLSGGEAQRIKLVKELAKRGKQTLYILDEPTTGLHTHDIAKLLMVLNRLVSKGNSMIVIEHNLDLLKTVDHIIDMGPEGGDEGGMIVAQGTPQQIAENPASYTGRYLKKYLSK